MMIILNFILVVAYAWMFIDFTFGDLVLSNLMQSLLLLTAFLAFLVEGLKDIVIKLSKKNNG